MHTHRDITPFLPHDHNIFFIKCQAQEITEISGFCPKTRHIWICLAKPKRIFFMPKSFSLIGNIVYVIDIYF